MPVGREQLDRMGCQSPDCVSDHDEFYFHSRCHREAPAWVSYLHGVLTISCAQCKSEIAKIAVAP